MTIRSCTLSLLTGALACAITLVALGPAPASAQQEAPPPPPPSLEQKIEVIKKDFAASQAKLRTFQWVQTTIVSVNGEEKKRKQEQCYYGEEGTLVKTLISESPTDDGGREFGIRGRIKEEKKRELRAYMENAHKLVHRYLPPTPELIQRCKEVGNSSIRILEPGVRAAVDFHNYLEENDLLSIEIDLVTNKILGVSVVSTMGESHDPITLNVTIGAFPDGTMYTQQSVLIAPARSLTVTIENAGFVPLPAQP